MTVYRKVALRCLLNCYSLASLYKNGMEYGTLMWYVEEFSQMFISEASFQTAMIPRPRLVAGVRPSNTPFCASELLSTLLQAVIHIATLTTAVKAGKQLELDYPRKSSHHRGFGIKCSGNDNCASAGSLFASLTGSLNSLHSNTDATSRSFWRRSPFEPNYLSNHVFVTSVFQHAVIDMVNHSGRPFSVSFMESRGLCMTGK